MDKDKNTNLKPVSPSDLKFQMTEDSADGDETEKEDYMLFNVMPKSVASAEIKAPSIKIQEDPKTQKDASKPSFLKRNKKKIIIILAVIFLGGATYFFINFLFAKPQENNFLINKDLQNNIISEEASEDETTTPAEWQQKYFSENCAETNICGDNADPERDGLINLEEYNRGTDPNNPDSDQDGIADGDEVNIFLSDPANSHTTGNETYTDADYFKGGYSLSQEDRRMTEEERTEIGLRMRQYDLHEPTVSTLADVLNELYGFAISRDQTQIQPPSLEEEDPKLDENIDQSPEAKQDRDAKRVNTIKKLAIGLVKYYEDLGAFPEVADMQELNVALKPYNKIATNPEDPINQKPYVYAYDRLAEGLDFNLTYYSETQGQLIRISKDEAEKYRFEEEAAINDEKRKTDLQSLRTALLLYSNNNAAGNQTFVFPTETDYKTAIVPQFIGSIPIDPKTGAGYEYAVSESFNTFTLKTLLEDPPKGTSGFLCNQEECRNY